MIEEDSFDSLKSTFSIKNIKRGSTVSLAGSAKVFRASSGVRFRSFGPSQSSYLAT